MGSGRLCSSLHCRESRRFGRSFPAVNAARSAVLGPCSGGPGALMAAPDSPKDTEFAEPQPEWGAGHVGPSPRWHGVFIEVFIEMVAVFRNNTEIPVYSAQFPPAVVVYETVTSVTRDTPAPCSGLPSFTWHPVVGAGMIFKSKSQQYLVRLNTQRQATFPSVAGCCSVPSDGDLRVLPTS